ncbi:MAG: sigma 54-interacting transcriptional regulator [Archangium sp.]|nr:sigma 54-interacting transcriptional regulator [Archangium sp.]
MRDRRGTWVTQVAGGRGRALASYRLTVTRGSSQGKAVQVRSPALRIGALAGNALQLDDPSVSGIHCELTHDEEGIRVRDLGSLNGTLIDGVLVRDAVLTRGATLSLGATEVRFEPGDEVVPLPASEAERFGPLLGKSAVMRELFHVLDGFAKSDATVLLRGETGAGKEAVAEALVQHGPRANAALVVVDCSALAPSLIESELFGHEKGAFTGAVSTREGAFERAHGGTVFLDEIGELPLELQPRLLRALERREVQRVGGSKPITVDVRIIAATHRALEEEVNRGRFRADLFYRLSVLRVDVPALRTRKEDLELLATHFAGRSIDAVTLERFKQHDWPGNVRELRNAVERWKAGAEPMQSTPGWPAASGSDIKSAGEPAGAIDLSRPYLEQKERMVGAFERRYVKALLAACKGNLAEGARIAGVSRMAVVKLVSRHGGE